MTTRLLLVDDSAAFRALLRQKLVEDAALQVVGEAGTAAEALALARQLRPDVITMDVRLPDGDGIGMTRRIMEDAPAPVVIVTGAMDAQAQELSLDAMRAGAVAAQGKPRHDDARAWAELRQLVRAMKGVKVVARRKRTDGPLAAAGAGTARLLAIAASTGGPPAIEQILAELPRQFALPVVVAQHLAPGFVGGFARWLARRAPLPVVVAAEPVDLSRPSVVLPPDGCHLVVEPNLARAVPAHGELSPSADVLFASAARHFGAAAVGVILTGMGEDGAKGLRELRRAGGATLAQDEASAVVYGMPARAVEAGAVDEQVSLEAMASRIILRCGGASS